MAPAQEEGSSPGFAKIRPVSLDLTARSSAPAPEKSQKRPPQHLLLWIGLGVLSVCVAAVIFVLPNWFETSAPASGPAALPAEPAAVPPQKQAAPVTAADAPWRRVQQTELRREAQEILQQMLDAQKLLTEKGVTSWAGEEYAAALEHAEAGDAEYAQQNFEQANIEYKEAFQILTQLTERIEPLFQQSIKQGNQALEEGNSKKAKAAFNLALTMDRIDRAALQGLARADSLDEVFALINQGDDLAAAGKLEDARAAYRKALELDGLSARAKEKLDGAAALIRDRDFSRSMSVAFGLLEQNQLDQARKGFSEALRIKPGAREALAGLEQAEGGLRANRIDALLSQAKDLETQERWRESQEKYESVLALDAGMSVAQQGKELTATRAGIHDRLEGILAQPARIYDEAVYAETAAFHRKLRGLANPGPTLSRQLASLEGFLNKAVTPVGVQLVSDNLTQVTLHKVGDLGAFTTRKVSLRPGRYVVAGYREGYQDARREFFVDPDKPVEAITIQADQKIALGR
ncbi:MAG: tetratricopeptide repeat protein [Gammaproteobacteria bacterium]|nr:tetratricopeptide repeat protein [Gammaproteobacteria bacterium]